MEKVFDIKNMHCRSCEALIRTSLMDEKGVKNVDCAYKTGKVKVKFDEKLIDEEKIRKIIGKDGYDVI